MAEYDLKVDNNTTSSVYMSDCIIPRRYHLKIYDKSTLDSSEEAILWYTKQQTTFTIKEKYESSLSGVVFIIFSFE